MKNKYKVGILTFHRANNYGAVLQAFALQNYLINHNIDCKIIDYDLISVNNYNKISLLLRLLKRKLLFLCSPNDYKRTKKFSSFRNKYLCLTNNTIFDDNKLSSLRTSFDIIIVGSDQVWNSDITKNSAVFYLPFDVKKKISYSASYGRNYLNEKEKKFAIDYLDKFYAISVREKSTVKELNDILGKKVHHVLDPVFLLKKNEWEKLLLSNNMDEYIFVYSMEYSDNMIETIKMVKNLYNKKMIIINGGEHQNYGEYGIELKDCGPQEFLTLLHNSSYVITNSFHGLAFSLIFQKNVICVKHTSRNGRLENLLEKIGCIDKQIDDYKRIKTIDDEIINCEKYYAKIENDINNSYKFIDEYIIK